MIHGILNLPDDSTTPRPDNSQSTTAIPALQVAKEVASMIAQHSLKRTGLRLPRVGAITQLCVAITAVLNQTQAVIDLRFSAAIKGCHVCHAPPSPTTNKTNKAICPYPRRGYLTGRLGSCSGAWMLASRMSVLSGSRWRVPEVAGEARGEVKISWRVAVGERGLGGWRCRAPRTLVSSVAPQLGWLPTPG